MDADFDIFSQDSYFDDQNYPIDDDIYIYSFDNAIYSSNFNESEEAVPNSLVPDLPNSDSSQDSDSLSLQNSELKPNNLNSKPKKKPTNLKPIMTEDQIGFMNEFYKHFTGRKDRHVRKELITRVYHPLFVQTLANKYNYKIRDVNRDEQRNIQLYFISFAHHKQYIMQAINDLEQENQINYQRDIQGFHQMKKGSSK